MVSVASDDPTRQCAVGGDARRRAQDCLDHCRMFFSLTGARRLFEQYGEDAIAHFRRMQLINMAFPSGLRDFSGKAGVVNCRRCRPCRPRCDCNDHRASRCRSFRLRGERFLAQGPCELPAAGRSFNPHYSAAQKGFCSEPPSTRRHQGPRPSLECFNGSIVLISGSRRAEQSVIGPRESAAAGTTRRWKWLKIKRCPAPPILSKGSR